MLNKMFLQQLGYEADRRTNYRLFTKNMLHEFDGSINYQKIPKELFRTSTSKVVALENFETVISRWGVKVSKHVQTTNIDNPLKDLVLHLKMNSKHKIFYEKLDPTLLDLINDVTNADVSYFHRDNFLYFKNFGNELKRDEIYSRIDAIKETANERGYNINS